MVKNKLTGFNMQWFFNNNLLKVLFYGVNNFYTPNKFKQFTVSNNVFLNN